MKNMAFVVVLVLLFCGRLLAEEKSFSLGVILGEPTGICGKSLLGANTAIDGAVAWTIDRPSFHLHLDYLFHDRTIIKEKNFMLFYGIGGRVKFENNTKIGMRIPVGIDYMISESPLDIFFEIAPIVDLIPGTYISLNAGIGIRYTF